MIILKRDEQIRGIRKASKIVALTFDYIKDKVKEGVTLRELDKEIERFIRRLGARPAFLGYRGFPAASCISLNEEVVHGIPDGKMLKNGDLVKIDIGVEMNGFYGDGAVTYGVGRISSLASQLMKATEEALYKGIEKAYPGNRISDISSTIEQTVKSYGFSVVKELAGHGVGLKLHEDPPIPNYGKPGKGPILKPGMTLAIEPMVNAGSSEVTMRKDGWVVVTKDGSLSAHFEHTVLITEGGPEILTSSDA